jgi:hypothetical protein
MNNKLNYQQAKRLREQSLSSVLADQLILGEGYGSAIGKAISLKTKAKITGIKQKFDPLNIAKMLTGGSRLGPAIVGKLLGRSRKDIEFFAGRARPVTTRDKRIGALPGGGEDSTGMSVVLNDILTFLQKSHEDDMVSREKENNLREGEKHEDERRHKKLLKALDKVGFGTASKVKPAGGFMEGFLDSVKKMIQDLKDKITSIIDDIKDFKKVFDVIKPFVGKLAQIGRWFMGPIGGPLLLAGSLAMFLKAAADEKEAIEANPNDPKYKDNPYAMVLRGETKSVNEGVKKNIKNAQSLKTVSRREVEDAVASGLSDDELKQTYKADRASLTTWLKENPNDKIYKIGVSSPTTNENATNTTNTNIKSETNVSTQTAAPVAQAPTSSAVSTKSAENQNLNIQAATNTPISTTTNTNVVNKNTINKPKPRAPIIAVRNTEPTFMQAIYNSTRVV